MADGPQIFADGIMDANLINGVARLTLAQSGHEGKPMPVGQLNIPLSQLPSLVAGLTNLLKQIDTRMREQQTASGAAAAPEAGAAEAPAVPGAFRFG